MARMLNSLIFLVAFFVVIPALATPKKGSAPGIKQRSIQNIDRNINVCLKSVLLDAVIPACTSVIKYRKLHLKTRINAYINRGQAYFNQKKYDKAISDFDQVIRLKPKRIGTYFSRGRAYAANGDYDRALADFTHVVHLKPNNPNLYLHRSQIYETRKQFDLVIADLDEVIKLIPKSAEAYKRRAGANHLMGAYEKAIADYSKVIQLLPKTPKMTESRFGFNWIPRTKVTGNLVVLGTWPNSPAERAGLKKGDEIILANGQSLHGYTTDEILEKFRQFDEQVTLTIKRHRDQAPLIITMKPARLIEDDDRASIYALRANSYKALKKFDLAIADYGQAIENLARGVKFYIARAKLHSEVGNYLSAVADYGRLLDLIDMGAARDTILDDIRDAAIADHNKALTFSPKNETFLKQRVRFWGNDFKRKLADYSALIELDPKNETFFKERADTYHLYAWSQKLLLGDGKQDHAEREIIGLYKNAIHDANNALVLNPHFAGAFYTRGVVHARIKEYDKAIADLSDAIRLEPEMYIALQWRSIVFEQMQKFNEAIADRSQVIKLHPGDVASFVARGNLYAKLKKHKEAKADYDKAIRLNPHLKNVLVENPIVK